MIYMALSRDIYYFIWQEEVLYIYIYIYIYYSCNMNWSSTNYIWQVDSHINIYIIILGNIYIIHGM